MKPLSGPPVALDAMGGDHAPAATVAGAIAARRLGVDVRLVGDPAALAQELRAQGGTVPVVAAQGAVAMGEEPAVALRAKPDASIRVAARWVAQAPAAALVSAGSTGATLAAALLDVGRLEGVRRPAIAARLPTARGTAVLVDAGGSPDVPPEALVAYARMGSAYAAALGRTGVRIGLLNVGGEPGKGGAFAKAAQVMLAEVEGWAGNVEPADVLGGAVDVVVTDGFTGNVFLKTVEAAAARYRSSADEAAPAGAAREPQRDRAALLLGVRAPVLIGHGAADGEGIAAMLRFARDVATAGLVDRIASALRQPPAPRLAMTPSTPAAEVVG